MFNIQRFSSNNVFLNHKIKFNINNQGEMPWDYHEQISKFETQFWVHKFHTEYSKITIDQKSCGWLKEASVIGMHTGYLSLIFQDELNQLCNLHNREFLAKLPESGRAFIRTDHVSLKYGKYGIGPYSSFEKVIESLVTSSAGHECIKQTDTKLNLYLLPWKVINKDLEFRVFVCKNQITAISQQHIFDINTTLNKMNDEHIISDIIYPILIDFDLNIRDKMVDISDSYVMDICVLDKSQVYFIEPNSFGSKYAAGSALFHWITDHHALHSNDIVDFRFVSS